MTVELDAAFVPVRNPCVHVVELDGEAVLLDEDTNRLHVLNATGALLWACFDGQSSIGEIGADISDELGTPLDVVLEGSLTLTRTLLDQGLLDNEWDAAQTEVVPREPDAASDPRFVVAPVDV
jgi:hypothetical protein